MPHGSHMNIVGWPDEGGGGCGWCFAGGEMLVATGSIDTLIGVWSLRVSSLRRTDEEAADAAAKL